MDIEALVNQIINTPLFLKLKTVIENNAYHDHESEYDHLLKTYKIAKEQIEGDFIQNPEAKKRFLEFVNTPFENLTVGKIMLLTALLHDVGKILYYKDSGKKQSLRHETDDGKVYMPGHEYWSSTVVGEFLKDSGLSEKVVERISTIIRLHGIFGAQYFTPISDWPIEQIIDDIKARAEGFYKEVLFNDYCDCFTAKPFAQAKEKIVKVFNQPMLYTPRGYFIPS